MRGRSSASTHATAGPTLFTVRVLQAETGLMTFGHSGAVGGEQVVVGEDVHAVVVAETETVAAGPDRHPLRSRAKLTRDRRATPTSAGPPWA